MSLENLNRILKKEVELLKSEGRAKQAERVIVDYIPAENGRGPRYRLQDTTQEFIRMNSNSYLSLSHHPELIKAADEATHHFGVGPGAVRFIDGTFTYHVDLEKRIGNFIGKSSAKIFNSAYTANCGLALTISNNKTFWIGDQLNHNSIIRAMRIANVPRENKAIYLHNNMENLEECFKNIPPEMERVVVIFDGIFSMRGDCAPIEQILEITTAYQDKFQDGVITVVDDSHGIGAYGKTGRGTAEYCGAQPDIIVGTFGKAFGVNGGFIAASPEVIEAVRQKADTYIYTNPLSVADCAAAKKAIDICDSVEGMEYLKNLHTRIKQFRYGLQEFGFESIPGPHAVVPILVRDTKKTHKIVQYLFNKGVLVVGLTFPVVPVGDETIRVQLNAAHTKTDVEYVLTTLKKYPDWYN
jgi:glycine C-acetyltransferase